MKILKKIIIGLTIILALGALLVTATGNTHLFKAISSTYLIGQKGPSINDLHLFDSRKVKTDQHKPWAISRNYNTTENPKLIKEIEALDPSALLIVKNDEIVYEKYWGNYDENSLTNSFSVAKTFISLLIGVAIDEEFINSVDDPVGNYLPAYEDVPELTIKDLLTMSSGINFDESYQSPFGHMAKAYYGTDLEKLNEKYTVTSTPGQEWKYLGGNTIILSFILEKATGMSISEYMSRKYGNLLVQNMKHHGV